MRSSTKLMIALPFLLGTLPTQALAATFIYTGTLSGANEVPANASTATGSYTVTLDDVANSVIVSLTFAGLAANASAGHIHCCAGIGVNAPVVIPFTGFPAALSGSYTNTFTGVSATNVNGIKGGLAYVNIHNALFPGGEIRGQINAAAAVPELTSWAMMIGGAGLVGGMLRRRKNARAFA